MDEIKIQRQVKNAKMWNNIIFYIFVGVLISSLIGIGIYKYKHTFTVEKWMQSPNERTKIVADMLEKYKLVEMTEEEVISLLGEEEAYASTKTSFKISNSYFDPENTIVYHLGVDYMDDNWLIISLENCIVSSYCIDVT